MIINTNSIKVALHHGDKVRLKQIQNYWCVYKALRALISPFRSFFSPLPPPQIQTHTGLTIPQAPGKATAIDGPFFSLSFQFLVGDCVLSRSEREHNFWLLLGGMGSEWRVDPAETDQRRLSQSGRVRERRHTHRHTHLFHLCHSFFFFLTLLSFTFHNSFVES